MLNNGGVSALYFNKLVYSDKENDNKSDKVNSNSDKVNNKDKRN